MRILTLSAVASPTFAQTGSLVQWGGASDGQVNNTPPLAGPYIAIAAGYSHSLALKADGSLVQWGDTSFNQTNNQPPLAGPYIAIAAGLYHSLALKADGSLVQWGPTNGSQAINQPPLAGPYIAIAAGWLHSVALRADGSLVQWGDVSNGQRTTYVGQPSYPEVLVGPYLAVATGAYHNLALRLDGSLVQWGNSSGGQLNNWPPLAGPYTAIAAGYTHSLALKPDGSLVQWGGTSFNQTNNQPPLAGPYTAIAAGFYHSLALKADGSLVQWGRPIDGQTLNQPPLAGPYRSIAAGAYHSLAGRGQPLGTFSMAYQGRLGGNSGPVDIRCRVFNAATGGNALGSIALVSNVTPDPSGVFTALLAFSNVDLSEPRWLEVAIAQAGSGTFTTLAPRQPITQTPRAVFADQAKTATTAQIVPWSGVTGVPANVVSSPWTAGPGSINYTAGWVGIGTTSPMRLLDVNDGVRINGPIQNSTTPLLTGDMGLYSSGLGAWLRFATNNAPVQFFTVYSDGAGSTSGTPQMTIFANGNVGIGTLSASQRLTVAGNVLANNVAVPSSIRFKDHVSTMNDALDGLLKLEGVRFDWKPEWAKERPGREHDIGFVAEDVAKVFPEVVFYDAQGNVTGMDYSRLTAVAVQAIKQLRSEKDAEIAALKERLENLEKRLENGR